MEGFLETVEAGSARALLQDGEEASEDSLNVMLSHALPEETQRLSFVIATVEEVAFRGWLSGRPGHIAGLLLGVPAGLLAVGAFAFFTSGTPTKNWLAVPVAIAAGTLVAFTVIYLLRRRRAMGWFQKLFPLLFWFSTICFAIVHLFNFELEQMAMALPMTLPQFATGTMLGYLRVNYGLWASIMLHTLHNGAFISLVLLGSSAA